MEDQNKLIGHLKIGVDKLKTQIGDLNTWLKTNLAKENGKDLLNLKLSLKVDNEIKTLIDGLKNVKKESKEAGEEIKTHFSDIMGKPRKEVEHFNAALDTTVKKLEGLTHDGLKIKATVDTEGNIKSASQVNYDVVSEYKKVQTVLKDIYNTKKQMLNAEEGEKYLLKNKLTEQINLYRQMRQEIIQIKGAKDAELETELKSQRLNLKENYKISSASVLDSKQIAEQNSLYRQQEQVLKQIHQTNLKLIKSKGDETQALLKLRDLDQNRLTDIQSQISTKNLTNQEKEINLKAKSIRQQNELNVAVSKYTEMMTKNENLTGGKTFMGKLFNSAAYLASAYILNALRVTIRDLITYTTELNKAMNEIQIVTGKSASEVDELAKSYNRLGKEMSVATREIANVAADVFRQGLDENQVEERMKAIIKYAKISSISLEESNKIITATANATGESVEKIIDIFALLGDSTSADAQEIGEALQRVANAAENSGLSLEKISSWISTISSITRESASTIGRSLNSAISRYESIKATGFNEEDATKLNDVVEALSQIGIVATDTAGQLRPFGEVVDELGAKYQSLTKNEQAYIVTTMFGTFQRNRGITLLNNYNDSLKNYEIALNSAGTAQQKYNIYLESTQAKLDKLKSTVDGLWQTLLSSGTINAVLESFTKLVNGVDSLVEVFGVLPIVVGVATVAMVLFTESLGVGIMTSAAKAVVTLAMNMGIAAGTATTLGTALGVIAPFALIAGFIGLTKVIDELNVTMGEYQQQVNDSYSKSQSNISRIKELGKEYETLAKKTDLTREEKLKLIDIEQELNTRFGDTTTSIDLQNDALDTNIKKIDDLTRKEADRFKILNERAYDKAKKKLNDPYSIDGNTAQYKNIEEAIKDFEESLKMNANSPDFAYNMVKKSLQNLYEEYDAAIDIVSKYEGYESLLNATNDEVVDSTKELTEKTYSYKYSMDEVNKSIDSAQSSLKSLADLNNQVAEGQELNSDQMLDLIQNYPQIISYMDSEGNLMVSQKELLKTLFDLKKQDMILTLRAEKDKADAVVRGMSVQRDAYLGFYRAMGATLGYSEGQAASMFGFDKETYDNAVLASKENQAKITALENLTFKTYENTSKKDKEIYSTKINQFQKLEEALSLINYELERNNILTDLAEETDKINLLSERNKLLEQQKKNIEALVKAREKAIAVNQKELTSAGVSSREDINSIVKFKDVEKNNEYRKSLEKLVDETEDWTDANRQARNELLDLDSQMSKNTLSMSDLTKELNQQKLDAIEVVESKIVEIIKKRYEEEAKTEEKSYRKKKDNLQKSLDNYKSYIQGQLDELDRLYDTEDYNKSVQDQTEKILKLKAEIATKTLAANSGDMTARQEISELNKDLKEEEEKLVEIQTNRERDLRKQNLQDNLNNYERSVQNQQDILDSDYENYKENLERRTTDQQLYLEAQTIMTNNTLAELTTMFTTFEDTFGSGMSLLGDVIQNEFINKLELAKASLVGLNSLVGGSDSTNININKMKTNSIAWNTASASDKKRLADENLKIGTSMGWTRDQNGIWYKQDGTRAYAKGGVNDTPGLAMLHGTKQSSEVIFNSGDAKKLYDIIHRLPEIRTPIPSFGSFDFGGSSNKELGDMQNTFQIYVSGNLDKSVVPDMVEEVARRIKYEIFKR